MYGVRSQATCAQSTGGGQGEHSPATSHRGRARASAFGEGEAGVSTGVQPPSEESIDTAEAAEGGGSGVSEKRVEAKRLKEEKRIAV